MFLFNTFSPWHLANSVLPSFTFHVPKICSMISWHIQHMILSWQMYGFPMDFHRFPMNFHGIPRIPNLAARTWTNYSDGFSKQSSSPARFPEVFPWFSYGYPMCFPWISQTLSHLPSFSTRSKHSSRSFAPPRVRRTMGWPWNTMFGWWWLEPEFYFSIYWE